MTKMRIHWPIGGILLSAAVSSAAAQAGPPSALTLLGTIDLAHAHYPAVRSAQARVAEADAVVGLSRTAYLPRLDLLWQTNRASRNNVFGMVLPQGVVPAISGPVLGTNSSASTWGSIGGALFSWELFDFGRRAAEVHAARAQETAANTSLDLTTIDVETAAADAFLSALAAQQAVRAAQATVDRMQVFVGVVGVLVDNQLRPAVDRVRAEAELAGAHIQLAQAQQQAAVGRARLIERLGQPADTLALDPAMLLEHLPQQPAAAGDPASHPEALSWAALTDAARARHRALGRSYFPRFNSQFAYYGRGTGARLDGRLNPDKGLWPDVSNWATGLTVTLPLFDTFGLHALRRAGTARTEAAAAEYDRIVQRLSADMAQAEAEVTATLRIAEYTPTQLRAAQETATLMRARYDAGLSTVVEVADAERLLTHAVIDDAVARLSAWRAAFALAHARGDLTPILQQITRLEEERRR